MSLYLAILGEEVALYTRISAKFCLSILGREVTLWVSAARLAVLSLQLPEYWQYVIVQPPPIFTKNTVSQKIPL